MITFFSLSNSATFKAKLDSLNDILSHEKYLPRKHETSFFEEFKEALTKKVFNFLKKLYPDFEKYSENALSIFSNPVVYYGLRAVIALLVFYVFFKLIQSFIVVLNFYLQENEKNSSKSPNLQQVSSSLEDKVASKEISLNFLISLLDEKGVSVALSYLKESLRYSYTKRLETKISSGLSDRNFAALLKQNSLIKEGSQKFFFEVIEFFEKNKFAEKDIQKKEILDFINLNSANFSRNSNVILEGEGEGE